jgi:transposase-like protein
MARNRKTPDLFRWLDSARKVVRFVVVLYVRYPLSLRNVEDFTGTMCLAECRLFAG